MTAQKPISLDVTFRGQVAVIRMSGGDNRINIIFCRSWINVLDKVEAQPDIKALVTIGSGRFYSNGLDLTFYGAATGKEKKEFNSIFHTLLLRLLCFPMLTVAAINGHCFASGVIFSYMHDYRVMQCGRGWMCLNEVDLGMRFSKSMIELMKTKMTPVAVRDCVIYGKRFTAEEALKIKLVDKITTGGNALNEAIQLAESLVKNRTYSRDMVHGMKFDFYGEIYQGMEDENVGKSSKL